MIDDKNENDRVGYRRPPKKHQFKPGQSGNPKGRPKGSIGLKQLVQQELNRRITISEDRVAKQLSMRELLIRSIFANALKGNPKAIEKALQLLREFDIPQTFFT